MATDRAEPGPRDYVLVGLETDEGEIQLGERLADVKIADLDDKLVLMGVPEDLTKDQKGQLRKVIAKSSRRVLVVEGDIGERWKVFRLVPKSTYDEDFDEATP